MKDTIRLLVEAAIDALREDGSLALEGAVDPGIERTRDPAHGDFACPVALILARSARGSPRDLAERIVAALPASEMVARVDIAGPGFINFHLADSALHALVHTILTAGDRYGTSRGGAARRIQLEFVSANPTGPLHVGHGRGAAYGAALANLLEAIGCEVYREYYVNDAGRQMDILALSVWLRCLERDPPAHDGGPDAGPGLPGAFPANAYRGDYIRDIARALRRSAPAMGERPPAFPVRADGVDDEAWLDCLIGFARSALGPQRYRTLADFAVSAILKGIKTDLEAFGVRYHGWFSERALVENGALERAIEQLQARGHVYEDGGALWFRSSAFGDEKDRVLVRDNGQSTYFASDVAYHLNKLERGFEELIDIWGADHHGYIPRVRGSLQGLGQDPNRLTVLLVQFANLYRAGQRVAMSTRSGEFVTLRALCEEVGTDAARYFYVMRKSDQHLDFDLDLAKSRSNENPVYYIQYAHARVRSVQRQREARGLAWSARSGIEHAGRLTQTHELDLLRTLSRYPEVVESAAHAFEPHQVAFYLRDVANVFHTYYNAHTFLVDDASLRDARIGLAEACRTVLRNGLTLLGVSAPESM